MTPDCFLNPCKISLDTGMPKPYIEYIERNNASMQQKETIMNDIANTPAIETPAPKAPAKKSRKPAAPVVKTFSVAQRARELKIDEKIARRRMRANVARTKPSATPTPVKNPSRKNARYEYARTDANLKMIDAIIRTPE